MGLPTLVPGHFLQTDVPVQRRSLKESGYITLLADFSGAEGHPK